MEQGFHSLCAHLDSQLPLHAVAAAAAAAVAAGAFVLAAAGDVICSVPALAVVEDRLERDLSALLEHVTVLDGGDVAEDVRAAVARLDPLAPALSNSMDLITDLLPAGPQFDRNSL